MRISLAWLLGFLSLCQPAAAQYRSALPGYRYEFPRDDFSHPDYQTEWWYYTGNVTAANGQRFGFELTFFRQAVSRDPQKKTAWDIQDLYLAHLALSDLNAREFFHAERLNRSGPGIAGIDEKSQRIWNGNWSIQWQGDNQKLQAADNGFSLELSLNPEKGPVIHGENGVSQKAAGPGRASHYISFTRLATDGSIQLKGNSFKVSGLAWMDHEFFTQQLEANQIGWDWLGLQLDDKTELMLYQIRRKDGSIDPFSSGTYVDAQGRSVHLREQEFTLQRLDGSWQSPVTRAIYPIHLKISVPRLGIELEVTTPLNSQEVSGSSKFAPSYWEGAIQLSGTRNAASLRGVGYLEMTGYDRPIEFGQ